MTERREGEGEPGDVDQGAASDSELRAAEDTRLLQAEIALQQDELAESNRRLEALHAHYHQLFDLAPAGFVRISKNHHIEDVNLAARELLGIDAAFRRRAPVPFTRFVSPAWLPAWAMLATREGGAGRLTLMGARGPVTADVRTTAWRGGEGGWLVAIDDVTELSEARARQLEAEERFGLVVQQMSDGLVVTNAATGLIEDHNAAFARFLGHPNGSLVGQPHDALYASPVRAIQTVLLQRALETGRGSARIRYRHADGGERVADVTIGVVSQRGANLEYFFVRDVTEELRVEEERRAVAARLAETQKLEALGQLAAGVAHDMNNLLAALLASTEVPPTEETMRDMRTVALRGRELTERLLAVSRRRPARSETFDLLAVVDEVVTLARRTFRREIAVSYRPATGPWMLIGDPGQWHQALLNLLINARDAIAGRGTIEVITELRDGAHVLVVRDDGVGMTEEVRRRAFEPFFTTKGDGQGTGLGLAHVRAVVSAHGGEVEIASTPGHGTTIELRVVTVDVERAPEAARRSAPPPAAPSGRTALVVDDEPFVCKSTARLLDRMGWTAVTTTSAVEAMRVMETRAFDLVLTDRSMPDVSGDDLVEAVRCRWPETPIVVMTGLVGDADAERLLALGVGAIVSKPFRLAELTSAIATSLERPRPLRTEGPCRLRTEICRCEKRAGP